MPRGRFEECAIRLDVCAGTNVPLAVVHHEFGDLLSGLVGEEIGKSVFALAGQLLFGLLLDVVGQLLFGLLLEPFPVYLHKSHGLGERHRLSLVFLVLLVEEIVGIFNLLLRVRLVRDHQAGALDRAADAKHFKSLED